MPYGALILTSTRGRCVVVPNAKKHSRPEDRLPPIDIEATFASWLSGTLAIVSKHLVLAAPHGSAAYGAGMHLRLARLTRCEISASDTPMAPGWTLLGLAGDAVLIAPVSTRFPCYQGI